MSERAKIRLKSSKAAQQHDASPPGSGEFTHSVNPSVDRILGLQRTFGNQAVQRMIQSGVLQAKRNSGPPHGAPLRTTANIDRLRELLLEGEEEAAISLMARLNPNEAQRVLGSDVFRELAIKAFDDDEMYRAMRMLRGNLSVRLTWMFREGTNWSKVRAMLLRGTSGLKAIRTNRWMRSQFVKICDDEEMAEAVKLLGGPLRQKLDWMIAEGTNAALVYGVLQQSSQTELLDTIADTRIMDGLKKEVGYLGYRTIEQLLRRRFQQAAPLEKEVQTPGTQGEKAVATEAIDVRRFLWSLSLRKPSPERIQFTDADWEQIVREEFELFFAMSFSGGGSRKTLNPLYNQQVINFFELLATSGKLEKFNRAVRLRNNQYRWSRMMKKLPEATLDRLTALLSGSASREGVAQEVGPLWLIRIDTDVKLLRGYAKIAFMARKRIVAMFEKWLRLDRQHRFEGKLIHEFVRQVDREGYIRKGLFVDQHTNLLDELKRGVGQDARRRLDLVFQATRDAAAFAGEPAKLPDFFEDVVVKTVVALPGGVTAGVGGALEAVGFEETGGSLKKVAKSYLKTMNYGDEKMIEQAVEGSALAGGLPAEIVTTIYGGPIAKAKTVIDLIRKGEDFLTLKRKMERFLELQDYMPQLLVIFENKEKLFALILGLEQNPFLMRFENWALQETASQQGAQKPALRQRGKGFGALLKKIAGVTEKIRRVLRPVVQIRQKIIRFLQTIAAIIGRIPLIDELLAMLENPKRDRQSFRQLILKFSTKVAEKFQSKFDEVRTFLTGLIARGKQFFELLTLDPKDAAAVITKFALDLIGKKVKLVKAASLIPQIKELVAKHVVTPLIPEGPIKYINGQLKKLAAMTRPAFGTMKEGINSMHGKVSGALKNVLLPGIQNLLIQRKQEDSHETQPVMTTQTLAEHMRRSSQETMPEALRATMEPRFGRGVRDVRIHTDSHAQQASKLIQARAFTLDREIYFGQNQFTPDTKHGQRLVAHELTHVAQQRRGGLLNTIQRNYDATLKQLLKTVDVPGIVKKYRSAKMKREAEVILKKIQTLEGKRVYSKKNPDIKQETGRAYFYTTRNGKIVGIQRKRKWMHLLPALSIEKSKIKVGRKQRVSLREIYLGATPGKRSATGRTVIERMRRQRHIRGTEPNEEVYFREPGVKQGDWYPIDECDMAHTRDAVAYWNKTGYKHGPKAPQVIKWMKDPKNYVLQPAWYNRSEGGGLKKRYRAPE